MGFKIVPFKAVGTGRSLGEQKGFTSLIMCRAVDSRGVPIKAKAERRSLKWIAPLWGYGRKLLRGMAYEPLCC